MDGAVPDTLYLDERRRRLAAERRLDHTRRELARAHSALVSSADRLSRDYLAQREQTLRLSARQQAVLAQRKEAAERADRARRRLWHALEAMRDGFALFDATGTLVAANHVYLDLFDAASDIAPGAHATEIFERAAEEGAFDIGDLAPEDWAAAQVARWEAETIEPLTLQHYDGRVLRITDRRAPDGDVVSLALDVTEHREREAALAAARDAAESAATARSEFLARMSHEIRTPMNGVIGLSGMLAEQAEDEELKLYATTIRDSAEALLVIVNDTLDVSRLEAGKVELRLAPLDLEMLLIDCIRLVAVTAGEGVEVGLAYPLDAPTRLVGDAGRIRQIVMNLLGNALKFTPKGHVATHVALSEGDDGLWHMRLTVRDTGPGVPPAMAETIFEAFGQIDDPARPLREGTGLGLTISRGLAERMGGTLVLDPPSAEGGAGFTLSLPLEPVGPPPASPGLPASVTLPADMGLRCDLAAARLHDAGCHVHRAGGEGARVVVASLAASHARQRALLAALDDGVHLVLLGQRAEAAPELLARAAHVLAVPVRAADLVAALHPRADATPGSGGDARQASRPRILVADDNATNRFLLEKMLAPEPYALEVVTDGQAAVDAYATARPDAVVLDISMPGLDGFAAAARIRAIEAERGGTAAPLIALTAHAGTDMAERIAAAGFDAYLTKPLRKEALLTELTRLTGES
ncbi:ATP-binding protein [Jannaschia marina]|uniref:ATP-binding protein n=1 Tax=Jannaschia marina TaxID=2741674 RepID=UPI0015CA4736|nr:ATP-binding protein [Jannaschia marina]